MCLDAARALDASHPDPERADRLKRLRLSIMRQVTYYRVPKPEEERYQGRLIRSNDMVETLPANGRWPFPPTVIEYQILQYELCAKGLAFAMEIASDPPDKNKITQPYEENFVIISRELYFEGRLKDEGQQLSLLSPLVTKRRFYTPGGLH